MLRTIRTNSDSHDFIELVKQLDAELAIRDGDDHAYYAQFNKTDKMKNVIVAYDDHKPVGCGAIREYAPQVMEVKRMYTVTEERGKGIASIILRELEKWAAELFSEKCILETGKNQPEAISLYYKNKYRRIPNYGQYAGMENSVCFEKRIR